jgi:SAM-dependent methyltransferase
LTADGLPIPGFELADRVSPLGDKPDPTAFYLEYGRRIHDDIVELLPEGWSLEGRRVLDFGAGAGRVLRHFAGSGAELHGSDIDIASVEWMTANLSPPIRPFRNGEEPGLRRPDGFFDLVYAVSVFTHITDHWAGWLLELRRVLRPDGILIATFIGEGAIAAVTGEPWDDARFGMNVLNEGQPWHLGGPTVIHSPWWLREHWGRAFEILELRPSGFANDPGAGHGVVVARPRPEPSTVAGLEAVEAADPREISALRHNIAQLHHENEAKRYWLDELQRSPSWRITAPLRKLKRAVRK